MKRLTTSLRRRLNSELLQISEQDAFTDLLLDAGHRVGCEALICTSFNRAGDPIVYAIEDAYDSAIKMRLDGVAGDGWLVEI